GCGGGLKKQAPMDEKRRHRVTLADSAVVVRVRRRARHSTVRPTSRDFKWHLCDAACTLYRRERYSSCRNCRERVPNATDLCCPDFGWRSRNRVTVTLLSGSFTMKLLARSAETLS